MSDTAGDAFDPECLRFDCQRAQACQGATLCKPTIMTVGELIKLLQAAPQDAIVMLEPMGSE